MSTPPVAAALYKAAAEVNQPDYSTRHPREDACRHSVLVAQDAESFETASSVLDLTPLLGDGSILFFLLRYQFATFGFLSWRGDFRMLLIGIRFIAKKRFVTQRFRQSLFEVAFFVKLDVCLRATMSGLNVEHLAFPIAEGLGLERVLFFLA